MSEPPDWYAAHTLVLMPGSDPQHQNAKAQWMARLTELYKFRHGGSDIGLNDLIARVLSQPLPQP